MKSLRLLWPHKWLLAFTLFVSLLAAVLSGVGDPVFQKWLIDSITEGDTNFFVAFSIGLMVLYTLTNGLNYSAALARRRVKNKFLEKLTTDAHEKLYKIEFEEVDNKDKGYFISRIFDEPSDLTSFVDTIISLFKTCVIFIGGVTVCFWLSWKVSIALSLIVPVLLYLSSHFGQKISDHTEQENEQEADLKENLGRCVESYKNINLFDLFDVVQSLYRSLVQSYLATLYDRVRFASRYRIISGTFLSYAEVSVIIGVGTQVLNGNLSIGGLFGFISAYWKVVNSFRSITSRFPELAKATGQWARLERFMNLPNRSPRPKISGKISLHGVNYSYDESEPILENLSFSVEPGSRVLLVGPNGSGKTTLAHMLSGFLDPQSGSAVLPSIEQVSALLPPFGFVPGTVRHNVGYERLSDQKRQRFNELLERFSIPHVLDRKTSGLSQGETRKVQVTMTLLQEADIYLFDEPLTNVDSGSKDDVIDAIVSKNKESTIFVIMHGHSRYESLFDKEIRLETGHAIIS